ncbi:sensor histidine kinase [Actinophytocola oryzae]|uniref:histidine kinase n=1 Tax=Actinophytocola oryzae TaxID=502181 RepID=A0A4R7VQM3_9PSEU|nr:sensor histidine kinase [Actinophytocola oryzae]TDV52053.1 histidine kinase [Actinophytocola oryzae]
MSALKRWDLVARLRTTVDAIEHIVGGLGTAVLAVAAVLWMVIAAVTCVGGVGFALLPTIPRVIRAVAQRERGRLSRWTPEIIGPEPLPPGFRAAIRNPTTQRELAWVLCHGTAGLLLGMVGVSLPIYAVTDGTFPLWWYVLPPDESADTLAILPVHDLGDALLVSLMGVGWLVVLVAAEPLLARLQAWPGRRLLTPDPGTDLALRVAHLTATRAAALDAHTTELRRIERSLHDGTQNRLVAVNVLLGAARRAVARDPAAAVAILDRAQDAAEQALTELRGVVRTILPPVLTDRTLPDALASLATTCPVPCRVDADVPGRSAASVEATVYFAVAETLTNVAKHSGARRATVVLRRNEDQLCVAVTDDGRGGADEGAGSGLAGIRRRVEAHDGTFALASPAGGPTTMTASLPCGL